MEPLRGSLLVLWNWRGDFSGTWCYVVVLSLAVLGFRYYICALIMLGVKMVATLVSYCAYHWHSVLYFHQARCAAEKFCSRGKATVLPENVLRIASCHGLAFTILSVVTQ